MGIDGVAGATNGVGRRWSGGDCLRIYIFPDMRAGANRTEALVSAYTRYPFPGGQSGKIPSGTGGIASLGGDIQATSSRFSIIALGFHSCDITELRMHGLDGCISDEGI